MHYPNPSSCRGIGCCFPLPANIGEKPVSGRTVFAQHFPAAVAVVSNRRSADDHLRWFFDSCNSFRDEPGTFYTAVADPRLSRGCPASGGDVLAGQMDNRISAIQYCGMNRPLLRVPLRRPRQTHDIVPTLRQQWNKRGADESCRTRYGDFHEGNYTWGSGIAALRLLFSKTVQCVMVLVIFAGLVQVWLADGGMAVHTLLVFFLGVFRRSGRERHKQKSHQAGYP